MREKMEVVQVHCPIVCQSDSLSSSHSPERNVRRVKVLHVVATLEVFDDAALAGGPKRLDSEAFT
jgi:hypothetical protein